MSDTPHLDGLLSPEEAYALRRGQTIGKGTPPVIERADKRTAKHTAEEKAKDLVWARDGQKSRASGKPVLRANVDNRKRGEVAHLTARSTNPKAKLLPQNMVLLTAEEHAWSDARTANAGGDVLLEIKGKDARKKLTFIRRNLEGKVLWRRSSLPPGKEKA